MPEHIRKQLGERLVDEGLITEEQFQTALKKHHETKTKLRQVLVDMGIISEVRLMEFIGSTLGVPVMKDVSSKITDPQIIKLIPEKSCRQYVAMPLFKVGKMVTVAMADPFDVFAIDDLESIAQCKIEVVLSSKDDIIKAIDTFYEAKEPLEEIIKGFDEKEADARGDEEDVELIKDDVGDEPGAESAEVVDAPIIRLVNTMITQAVKERASDIHIESDEKNLRIRYRVDGILRIAMSPPKRLHVAVVSRIKIMASMDISVKRTPQDGRFRIRLENKDFDVRISTVPTIYGEKVVMRLLDQTSVQVGVTEIGFDQESLARFKELIVRPYGIILVTGPTGSGKTTTLYCALQTINSPEKNIITIEEPVEYDLEGINQIAVNVKAGVTFATGLRSILRQDPDVIMVGEMRDLETANIAVRAALTGHLVFSTLHTNDAPSSVTRMIDMGVPSYLVTSSVACVLAQRLVRTICPDCREPYQPPATLLQEMGLDNQENPGTFYQGKGCENCADTGYRGRIGVFELMIVDKELRDLIHAQKSTDDIRAAAQRAGMKTLWEDGLAKVHQGLTTLDELKRVTFTEQQYS